MLGESRKSEEEMESILSEIEESQKGELVENRMIFSCVGKDRRYGLTGSENQIGGKDIIDT